MTLRLSVVSEHGIRLGALSSKVFGVHGGSIGRGSDNEWILPDPERYLSGKHARIDFRAGNYILVDTSSNGTYVNGAQVPLGKYHDYLLKDGDYIRLGEYEFLVSIDKGNDFPPDQSAIVAYDGTAHSSAARKSTADDLGADLDLSELLEPSDQLTIEPGIQPRNAYGQPVATEPKAAAPAAEGSETPWHMMTRPLKPGTPAAAQPPSAAHQATGAQPPFTPQQPLGMATGSQSARSMPPFFPGDLEPALAVFCRGAGIDPNTITAAARNAALHLAGQLLRESVLGLMDLNHSRNEFRNRFRIAPPPEQGPESPLNLARGVDEALVRLLNTTSSRAGSVDAVREVFRELKAQSGASLAAMRSAFEEFLERVDPKQLEERFERAGKRGVFGVQNKGKYWDMYTEMFPGLAQRPADGFPHVFTETFAKAYDAKLRTLVPPRRTTFGADRNDPIEADDKAVGDL
jgi:type VI secretion system protein